MATAATIKLDGGGNEQRTATKAAGATNQAGGVVSRAAAEGRRMWRDAMEMMMMLCVEYALHWADAGDGGA